METPEIKSLSLDEAIAHADEVAGDCGTACRREHKQLACWLRELKSRRSAERGDAAKLREALMQIYDRVNSLDEECAVDPVEIRDIAKAALSAPAPTKVKAYTALHRTRRDGPWYMSEFIYRDARQFDELRRRCAERCDREGDSYGAAMWRDDANMKIIPVEVVLPDGIEIIDLDTTSSQPTKEGDK